MLFFKLKYKKYFILTDDMLRDKYKDYTNIHGKIAREIKRGNLVRIVKGYMKLIQKHLIIY